MDDSSGPTPQSWRASRPPFLDAGPAAFTHRASGGTIAALVVVIAVLVRHLGEHGGGVPGMRLQVIGSLLVALAIVAITTVAVTAQLGPTGAAKLEASEELLQERLEQQEELREERQDP